MVGLVNQHVRGFGQLTYERLEIAPGRQRARRIVRIADVNQPGRGIAAIVFGDGPYGFSFRSSRMSPSRDSASAAANVARDGTADAAAAAAPSRRSRCRREIVITATAGVLHRSSGCSGLRSAPYR